MGDIGVWVKVFEACIVSLVFFSSVEKVIWNHRNYQGEPENKTGFVFAEGHRGWVQTWHTRRSVSSKSSGFISCIHPAKSPSTRASTRQKTSGWTIWRSRSSGPIRSVVARLLVEKTLLRPAKSEAELRRGIRSFWAVFCLFYLIIWEKAPQLWLDSCYTGASMFSSYRCFFFSVFSHWLSSLEGKTEARGSERLFRSVAMCRPPARCHWNTSEPLWSSWQFFSHLMPTQ